ncbi:MFS transporter [Micromonospora sp. NPDC047074]|uniref:MFS transporter n=1 Tax=Micromonospora sp. NPDC047074 TaxID=3154339 RepID=UPI0033EF8A85
MRQRRPFALLLVAQYLSSFGNAITVVTVPLYVLEKTGSPVAAGLAGFAGTLPLIFAGAVGGVWTDRLGGRRMSVICDAASGLFVFLVPLLNDTVGLPITVLMLLLFGRGLVSTPASSARLSLLKPLSEAAGVPTTTAATWFQGAPRLGLVVGAPLGAVLVGVSGAAVGMYIDAATFLIAALLVGFGVPARRREPTGVRPNFLSEMVAGAAVLKTVPVVMAMTAFVFVTNLLDDAFTPVILPVYARDVLSEGNLLGWMLAASGVGAVIGTFIYPPLVKYFVVKRRLTLLGCFTAIGLLRLVLAIVPHSAVAVGVCLLLGLAAGPLNPVLSAVMMERVPEDLQGRVFGLTGAVAMSAAPLGILGAGLVLDVLAVRTVIVIFGLAYLALIVASLPSKSLRQMDPDPEPAAPADQGAVRA